MYTADELEIRCALAGSPRAEQLIACLEGEIAKRDEELAACRVAVENCDLFRARIAEIEADRDSHQRCAIQAMAELAAIKAQDTVGEVVGWYRLDRPYEMTPYPSVCATWHRLGAPVAPLYAAPVSEAKAQGEYGDAYQGAREDLAIWKRRALEAEEKVLQQEQIIDHLTSEAQGESRFGEPVVTPDAPCVPDGYVLADKKALGTVLQALVNAPHHIRELQVTLQPIELFSDNPINVLIANYEAPAAPVQQPKCRTCDDNGLIGGPSFYSPDEGGEPCPDCCSTVQQVSVPDVSAMARILADRNADACNVNREDNWAIHGQDYIDDVTAMLAAAPAAPAADAGLVEALDYQVLFDAIAAATSVYANGAINISVQAFRDALDTHTAKGVV